MISDITLFVLQIFDISRRIRAHTRSLGGSVLNGAGHTDIGWII